MRAAGRDRLISLPRGYVVLHNNVHSRVRQRANIAHELAHVILDHPFTLPIDPTGSRNFDRDREDEANWLGPVILIPNEAALYIVREALDSSSACAKYGVSSQLLQMRINASGARIRIARSHH